jgi:thiamine pyrophosphokinase
MRAAIVANGELEDSERLRALWRDATLRIAADGGAMNARRALALPPHIISGDMDSMDADTFAWCKASHVELIRHPRAKVKTDLELALDLARERGASEIVLLGVLGGRFDQQLANVLLLVSMARARMPTRIVGHAFEAQVAWEHAIVMGHSGETVSLIPLTPQVEGVATEGLLYPLRDETLYLGSTRSISNELVTTHAEVILTSGVLLVAHQFQHEATEISQRHEAR